MLPSSCNYPGALFICGRFRSKSSTRDLQQQSESPTARRSSYHHLPPFVFGGSASGRIALSLSSEAIIAYPGPFQCFIQVKSTLRGAQTHLQIRELGYNERVYDRVEGNRPQPQGAQRAGVWCKSGGRGCGASSRSGGPKPRFAAVGSDGRARYSAIKRAWFSMPIWVVPRSAFVPWDEAYFL